LHMVKKAEHPGILKKSTIVVVFSLSVVAVGYRVLRSENASPPL